MGFRVILCPCFEEKTVESEWERGKKNEEIRHGRHQERERLGRVTDIMTVLVRLMEPWPASNGCQQASIGKLSLLPNDLYSPSYLPHFGIRLYRLDRSSRFLLLHRVSRRDKSPILSQLLFSCINRNMCGPVLSVKTFHSPATSPFSTCKNVASSSSMATLNGVRADGWRPKLTSTSTFTC